MRSRQVSFIIGLGLALCLLAPAGAALAADSPSMDAASNHTSYSIKWNWHLAGALPGTTYNLMGGTSPGDDGLIMSGITRTGFTESGLLPNTRYYRHVHALDSGGESGPSGTVDSITLAQVPGDITTTGSWQSDAGYRCTVSWSLPSPGSYHHINVYRGGPSGAGGLVYSGEDSSCVEGGLDANTTYSYFVYSVNNDGRENFAGESVFSRQESPTASYLQELEAVDGELVWAAGFDGTVLRSHDGGTTWADRSLPTTEQVYALSAVDENIAWVSATPAGGGSHYLYKTVDGGSTWSLVCTRGSRLRTYAIDGDTAIRYVGDDLGWGIISRTSDGGLTWSDVYTYQPDDSYNDMDFYGGQLGIACGSHGYVLVTVDGGLSWTRRGTGTSEILRHVSVADASTAWVGGDGGVVLRSLDAGETWVDVGDPYNNYDTWDIGAYSSEDAWVLLGGAGYVVQHTGNGGLSWDDAGRAPYAYALSVINQDHLLACGYYGFIYRYGPTGADGLTPPGAPEGLVHTRNTTSTISWDWSDVAAATNYNAYRGPGGDLLSNLPASEWVEEGLSPNQLSTIFLRASNGEAYGEGAPCEPVSAYSSANVPAGEPFSGISESALKANWSNNSNPEGTEYLCENTTTGKSSGWTTSRSWLSSGLEPAASYSFRVRARNGDGDLTDWTELGACTTSSEIPRPAGSILINDGAPSTTTSAVSLKLNASCKAASSAEIMMRLSNRADLAGSGWQPLKKSLPWKLAAGRGRRMVYVRYRGPGGALSPVYADSIDVVGSGLPTTYYLAEGYTAQGTYAPDDVFDTWVLVQNPSGEDARLRATFMVNGSAGNVTREYVARAHSRLSIAVDEIPGLESTDVSTRVECLNGVGIAVERAMYFSYRGAVGSSGSIAVSEPSRTWYFGEGYTADGFDTWILVQNPGDEDALVEAAFVDEKGHVGRHAYPVPARTRYTIEVDRVPGFQSNYVATSLSSNSPVVAERAMYFNYRGVTGGHNSVGSTAPATAWYLPEGYVSRDPNWFDTYVLLTNPGEEDCEITATYMRNFRDPVSERFTIPPHSRKTVLLNEVPGLESTDVSCLFASGNGVAFVAERSSYFDYYGIREGTNSLGSVAAHSDWYVPQGYQSDTWDTWILVENPNPREAVCHVSFMTEAGKVVDGTYTVPASSRYTIGLGRVDAVLDSTGVSIAVHTARSTPVVVERATYNLYRGLKGGDTSIGIGVN